MPLWTRNSGAFKSTESSFAKLEALKDSTAVWELYLLLLPWAKPKLLTFPCRKPWQRMQGSTARAVTVLCLTDGTCQENQAIFKAFELNVEPRGITQSRDSGWSAAQDQGTTSCATDGTQDTERHEPRALSKASCSSCGNKGAKLTFCMPQILSPPFPAWVQETTPAQEGSSTPLSQATGHSKRKASALMLQDELEHAIWN